MCLTLCTKRQVVYDNDFEHCQLCPEYIQGQDTHGCSTCRWNEGNLCRLTKMPPPTRGWCCNQNTSGSLEYAPGVPLDVSPDGFVFVATREALDRAIEDYKPETKIRIFGGEDADTVAVLMSQAHDISEKQIEDLLEAELLSGLADGNGIETAPLADGFPVQALTREQADEDFLVPVMLYPPLFCFLLGKTFATEAAAKHCVNTLGEEEQRAGWLKFIDTYAPAYGGWENVRVDWAGRVVIYTPTFALPAVYGDKADEWGAVVGHEGLERMIINHGLKTLFQDEGLG